MEGAHEPLAIGVRIDGNGSKELVESLAQPRTTIRDEGDLYTKLSASVPCLLAPCCVDGARTEQYGSEGLEHEIPLLESWPMRHAILHHPAERTQDPSQELLGQHRLSTIQRRQPAVQILRDLLRRLLALVQEHTLAQLAKVEQQAATNLLPKTLGEDLEFIERQPTIGSEAQVPLNTTAARPARSS